MQSPCSNQQEESNKVVDQRACSRPIPDSCRSKRVDDHSRFYANFRDFRSARVSMLLLKPNADPVVLLSLSSAAHEAQRVQCSALFVVVAEQEILLNHDH